MINSDPQPTLPQQFQKVEMRFLYKKKHNAKISTKRREDLIHQVIQKGKSITYAAKKLRIKYSTARIIIINFRETGNIFSKNMHRKDGRSTSEGPSESESEESHSIQESHNLPEESQRVGAEPLVPNPVHAQFPQNMVFYFYPYYQWPSCQ